MGKPGQPVRCWRRRWTFMRLTRREAAWVCWGAGILFVLAARGMPWEREKEAARGFFFRFLEKPSREGGDNVNSLGKVRSREACQ